MRRLHYNIGAGFGQTSPIQSPLGRMVDVVCGPYRAAKELRHSRETVTQAIESAEPKAYTLKRPRHALVLGPYKARIDELLVENELLPREQRYTGPRSTDLSSTKATPVANRVGGATSQDRDVFGESSVSDWVLSSI